MKDYSLNLTEQNKFILNYKIDKGNIVYKLANGNKITIPYTEENEAKIINIMENQVENSDKFLIN